MIFNDLNVNNLIQTFSIKFTYNENGKFVARLLTYGNVLYSSIH